MIGPEQRTQGHDGCLPVAPVARRLVVDAGIGVHQPAMIGVDQAAVGQLACSVSETFPCLREEHADALCDHLKMQLGGRSDIRVEEIMGPPVNLYRLMID